MKLNHYLTFAATSIVALTGSTQAAIAPVNLGTAGDYVILAKTAVTITTTPGSSIVGDLGLSPAAMTAYTGFDQDEFDQYATSAIVTGRMYAASMGGQTQVNLTAAIGAMEAAYTDAAGRADPDHSNLDGGNLNAAILTPGLYNWGTNVTITGSIIIDGLGDPNAVWIFQVSNRLTLSSGAQVILEGNANAANIFWQTAEGATLGTNSHFIGTILTAEDIAVQTNASVLGHLLAQTAVTMDSNAITVIPEPTVYAGLFGVCALAVTAIRRRMKKSA